VHQSANTKKTRLIIGPTCEFLFAILISCSKIDGEENGEGEIKQNCRSPEIVVDGRNLRSKSGGKTKSEIAPSNASNTILSVSSGQEDFDGGRRLRGDRRRQTHWRGAPDNAVGDPARQEYDGGGHHGADGQEPGTAVESEFDLYIEKCPF
jgi:hypothetical protein